MPTRTNPQGVNNQIAAHSTGEDNRGVRVLNWNVAWATASSKKGKEILKRVGDIVFDVACFTECTTEFIEELGLHAIFADSDYGYKHAGNRRKVALVSKCPWRSVRVSGPAAMPGGRYVMGETDTWQGSVILHGVCIPWKDAHVRTGRNDRRPWEDHLAFLTSLKEILAQCSDRPQVLIGDFNQRVPRKAQPRHVYEALIDALPASWRIATGGAIPPEGEYAIDHIAHSLGLVFEKITSVSNERPSGKMLSDHFGVTGTLLWVDHCSAS